MARLRVPCSYQGGKQRVAPQIVEVLLRAAEKEDVIFYDLCCGSGAISIELVNRGVDPSRIVMVDLSSWGAFWDSICSGDFDLSLFNSLLGEIPIEKRDVKAHMTALAALPMDGNEAELYPILQASSFGGKQIWYGDGRWNNAYFRSYWEPTENSVRRSPANPMQPSPGELCSRVTALAEGMKGARCFREDIMTFLESPISENAVVYIDPPYGETTGYGFKLDLAQFVSKFRELHENPLFISEGKPLAGDALHLVFGGAKGGITGTRAMKHQEWLTRV